MPKKYLGYAGWTVVISVAIYFVAKSVPHYVTDGFSPKMIPFKGSFLVHIICGTIMISFGPLQFVQKIRRQYPKVHRFMGRTYVICVLLASLAALYIAVDKIIMTQKDITYGVGLAGLSIASLLTTTIAFWMIRNRNYQQHQEWMVRSYVVTMGFATFRLFADLLYGPPFNLGGEIFQIMAWACWSVPLMITEVFLQLNRTSRAPAFGEIV